MKKKYNLTLITLSKSQGGASIAAERIRLNLRKKFKIQSIYSKNLGFFHSIKYIFAKLITKIFIRNELLLNSPNLFSKVNLKDVKGEIIFLNWIGEETISIDDLISTKKMIIWTIHDLWPFTSTEHFLENPLKENYLEKDSYKNYLKKIIFKKKKKLFEKKNIFLITNSKWLEKFCIKSSLTRNTKVKTIYNPIETNLWKRKNQNFSKKQLGLNLKKKYILVGAHGGLKNYRKGGDLLIESLKHMSYLHDEFEFLILGNDTNTNENINGFIFNFRKFTSNKTDQMLFHSASELTVSPSRAESIPQFIVETILCNNPVVSFDIGGMSEIIDHKKNGFLASPFNKKRFAQGIIYCLKNCGKKNLFNHRKKIVKMFDQKKNLNEYSKVIKSFLKS